MTGTYRADHETTQVGHSTRADRGQRGEQALVPGEEKGKKAKMGGGPKLAETQENSA